MSQQVAEPLVNAISVMMLGRGVGGTTSFSTQYSNNFKVTIKKYLRT